MYRDIISLKINDTEPYLSCGVEASHGCRAGIIYIFLISISTFKISHIDVVSEFDSPISWL